MAPPPAAGGGFSLGDLYSKCVQMVNENKISTKNAWELPLIEHMDDIVDSFMGGPKTRPGAQGSASTKSTFAVGEAEENRFHEASCTIEASARIYACRVDCVHTDTYKVLGGLNSADMDDEGKEGDEGKGPASKRRRIVGVNTLEKNEANIVQTHLEVDEQSDPAFRRMAAAFDAGGAKGLLLSHLPMAEDISLVFNGDLALNHAVASSKRMFSEVASYPSDKFGFGDLADACSRISEAKACSQIDPFRQMFFGAAAAPPRVELPAQLEALFGPASMRTVASEGGPAAAGAFAALGGLGMAPLADADDLGAPFDDGPVLGDNFPDDDGDMGPPVVPGEDLMEAAFPVDAPQADALVPQQLLGGEQAIVALDTPGLQGSEDVIAFDELFKKFCGSGGANQFAYFDECWSKVNKDGKNKDDKEKPADAPTIGPDGTIVPSDAPKEKAPKRPLFDITGLGKPVKPIETEPVHKHQLSERAVQWQLHKDVPPYMIDRITMPSWPTWSKCDFACLGLRPHLMLKLVRKPVPEDEGPHGFSDLFSTVIVENPEAFPWLASDARGAAAAWRSDEGGDDAGQRAEREMAEECGADDVDDDDFAGNGGLPAHLDVDPQDLFLRPGDKVLPSGGAGADDGPDDDLHGFDDYPGGDEMAGGEAGFAPDLDLDMCDRPDVVGDTDIGYSRNSKFVDVKLVKKHLWDCIAEDMEETKATLADTTRPGEGENESSFQQLIDRTMRRLPKAETPNLSVAVCFICALHLCNEKGLELRIDETRPAGDFTIVGNV